MTERLVLRPATDAEMEELIAGTPDEDIKTAYGEMLAGCRAHPAERQWYAVWFYSLKDGTVVGDLSFKGVSPDGMTEIGYGVYSAFAGQGYTTEAVIAAARWAQKQPGITRVEAETEPDNRASQRVLEKAGFRPTGTCGLEGPRYYLI